MAASVYDLALYDVALYDVSSFSIETVSVPAIISGGGYTVFKELYRCTIDNDIVEEITDQFIDGAVDMNLDRAVKLAATFTIHGPSNIRPYTDFLAPYIRMVFDDGSPTVYQQCGLFSTRVAPGSYRINDSVATFDGADLTSVLASAFYPNGTSNSAGTNYGDAIKTVINNGGIARTNIPVTAVTLPTAQSFGRGSSRLDKANTYCDQMGWYHLGVDLDGKVSTPGAPQNLASIEPWRVITNADLVGGVVDVQPTGQEIANVILVINDDAASAPLKSIARNDDPSSPTSTVGPASGGVGIGREITRVVKVTGSTTQAALDALAARYLAESRTYYRTAKLTLLHDPTALRMHQVAQLTLTGHQAGLSGKWRVRMATLGLTHDRATTLELNQISDDLGEAVI